MIDKSDKISCDGFEFIFLRDTSSIRLLFVPREEEGLCIFLINKRNITLLT